MKKLITILLVLLLAACSGNKAAEDTATDTEMSDMEYIIDKGTLVVGITDFEPMDYRDENGEWIGFDADIARKVAEDLGVKVEFVEIKWDNKILELENKSIDVVWNGMTLTDEVKNAMETTNAYCNNSQVVVMRSEVLAQVKEISDMEALQFAVEAGSAGEGAAKDNGFNYIAVSSQADAFLEVMSGTSDACIVDLLMASALTGEGSSYESLSYGFPLTDEEYGVGCRKGSDLAAYINDDFKVFWNDGSLKETAEKYGVEELLVAQ